MSKNKYAVIYSKTRHVAGDHPGHGYPSHSYTESTIKTFDSKEELEDWIKTDKSTVYSKIDYQAIQYQELSVATSITTTVKIEEQ